MSSLRMLPLHLLDFASFNPRKTLDQAKLAELTNSIRVQGVLQPVLARPIGDRFELICGQRRTMAARQAGLSEIPAVVREMTDEEAIDASLTENIQREDPEPLDEAEAIHAMLESGYYRSDQDVADRLGKSPKWVYRRRRLLHLAPPLVASLQAREFPVGWYEVASTLDSEIQAEALAAGRNLQGPRTSAHLRAWVDARGLALSRMPWDLEDDSIGPKCAGCNFNTATQGAFFDQPESRCLNQSCAAQKLSRYSEELAQRSGAQVASITNHQMVEEPDGQPYVIATWGDPRFNPGQLVRLRVIEEAPVDSSRQKRFDQLLCAIAPMSEDALRSLLSDLPYCIARAATTQGKPRVAEEIYARLGGESQDVVEWLSTAVEPDQSATDPRIALAFVLARSALPEAESPDGLPPIALNEITSALGLEEKAA